MRRSLLFAIPCALVATALIMFAAGVFRGRDAGPPAPAADATTVPPPAEHKDGAPTRSRHEPYPFKRVVVVAIGINHYPKLRGTTDLRYAVADAAEVADVCETLYGFEAVRVPEEKATKREIENALARYGKELGEEDALVVYFAGHGRVVPLPSGEEAGYLVPADADLDLTDTRDPARWAEQALDMQRVAEQLDAMTARHVVFVADACCSGFLIRRGALERADLKTFLLGEKSRCVLAATTRHQQAREDVAAKHGYFTAALLDELRKDDAASVLDLYAPVMKRVAAKTNGAMTPQFGQVGAGDGMFVFVPKSIPRSQVESDLNGRTPGDTAKGLAGVQTRTRERAGMRATLDDVIEAYDAPDYRHSAAPEESAKRWEAKFARHQLNAPLGDPWAMAALHLCYAKGLGTPPSAERAYHSAKQADRFKAPPGLGRFVLGRCYEAGTGVAANPVAAEKLVGEAAEAGFPLALLARGERLILAAKPGPANLKPADRAAAEKDLTRAFEAGVPSASVPLARLAFVEKEPKADVIAAAVKRLEAAAEKGVPEAHHALWTAHLGGREKLPARNLEKAKAHLLRAAEAGHAVSQRDLAAEYYRTPGEFFTVRPAADWPADPEKAFRWASLAAAQNDPGGHFLLAQMYRHGKGVTADHEKYRTHLDDAANLKWAAAMNELFWELCRGKVYTQDFPRALQMAEQSAGLGHADGHYNLGYYHLALLDPDTKKVTLKEGVETFLSNDHANTHRTLHHYWQAYKLAKHPGAKRFLESYWETHTKNRGSLAVDDDLEKHFPETAKELFASPDFGKAKK